MKTPTVSVALATFNGEKFLEKQLKSIAAQEWLPDELVVCDDLSNDNTMSILYSFSKIAPFPVRISRNDIRLHYSDNFLKAASLCAGEYISFSDQDDIWLPNKIKNSVESLLFYDAYLCAHDSFLIDKDDAFIGHRKSSPKKHLLNIDDLDPWDVFAGHSCTFKSSILSTAKSDYRPADLILPQFKSAHDRWIYFLAAISGPIIFLEEPLILYRQHGANVYGSRAINALDRIKKVHNSYANYLNLRHKISDQYYDLVKNIVDNGGDYPYLERSVEVWESMRDEYEQRVGAFEDKSPLTRLANIYKISKGGAYRDWPSKPARTSIMEDAIAALIAKQPEF